MLRLPTFTYHRPKTAAEAVAIACAHGKQAMYVAGGTDLYPNMKRRHQAPSHVISLQDIPGLDQVEVHPSGGVRIGALAKLSLLEHHPYLRQHHAALAHAVREISTPLLRNMGTIGGNLLLDTRCTYYDQTYEWRKSIDFCMKKDGQTCWVATSSPKCLAVSSTDTAPMLQALGASVTLASATGKRVLPLAELFANDGMHYLTRRPDEILTAIALPPADGWRSAYWKLRRRGSFDFPVAAAAVAAKLDDRTVADVRIVLGAVASRPVACERAAALLKGRTLTDEAIADAAAAAAEPAKPMDNTDFELVWRKAMVKTLVACALQDVRGDDMRQRRRQLARQELLASVS